MKFTDYQAKKTRGDHLETGTKDQKPKSVKFKAGKDNGRDVLHEARWLRQPITDPKTWFKEMPIKREQVYRNLQFEFYGTDNAINDKTVAALHDRSLVLEIKHFLSANSSNSKLAKANEQGSSSSADIIWDPPKSLISIQEALNNYAMALHQVWPMDMSAIVMQRVLIKYHWVSAAKNEKTRLACITQFFNDVMRSNVRRALNGKACLDFDGQEKSLKSALTKNDISAEVPLNSGSRQDYTQGHRQAGQQTSQQKQNPKGQPPKKRSDARFNGLPVCFAYNGKGRTCTSQSTATGCSPKPNVDYAHVCSKWIFAKNDFCYGSHPEEKHR